MREIGGKGVSIVDVNRDNLEQHPGVICFINPRHPSYPLKIEWMKKRFSEGMKIKLLYLEGEKKPVGYIEYLPGENAWRGVRAGDYMFIHCIWTNGKKYQHQGLGAMLIEECEKDAQGTSGVAVITSDGPFMVSREIFTGAGYRMVEEKGKDQLLVKSFKEGPDPGFTNDASGLEKYQGLHILYSSQCPWVARLIQEIETEMGGLKVTVKEISSAEEAQNAPSVYSVFNLIYNGKILSDRYISLTRLKNILKKEKIQWQ